MFTYLIVISIIFLILFNLEWFTKKFLDESLENEKEKENYLKEMISEDYCKNMLKSKNIDEILFNDRIVERPIKKTGKWEVFIDWGVGVSGRNIDKTFEITDKKLGSLINEKPIIKKKDFQLKKKNIKKDKKPINYLDKLENDYNDGLITLNEISNLRDAYNKLSKEEKSKLNN